MQGKKCEMLPNHKMSGFVNGLTSAGSQADLVSPPSRAQGDAVQQSLAQRGCGGFAEPSSHSYASAIF